MQATPHNSNTIGMIVPEFLATELTTKSSKYALIIPVINEAKKIQKQLTQLKDLNLGIDIIIADGGSTDGSLELEFLNSVGVSALLVKTGPGKLSAQMRMGMGFALRRGYEGLIFVDGNNKDDLSAIPSFIAKLEAGYDHVQGSRFIKGGYHENTPLLRWAAIRLLHAPLISISSGFWYTDTTNGFRAYSRTLLTSPEMSVFRGVFSTYELHYYLAIRSARLGFKICEIPVKRCYPKGQVPSKITSWRGYWFVFTVLLKAVFHRYDPVA